MSGFKIIGWPVPRLDALIKVCGEAVYTDDHRFPGMLYGRALRSPIPHGLIRGIDLREAYRVPGVKAIVTGEEFPYRQGLFIRDEPFLAQGRVRYVGEAVAAVAATSPEAAQKGVEAIRVVYDPLPAVFDPWQALQKGAPLVHADPAAYPHSEPCRPVPFSNICSHFKLRKGDVEKAFRESVRIFESTYETSFNQHCALEPHCAIGLWDGAGKLTLWTGNDGPHRCRREIALALDLPQSDVRVIAAFQGGGFGSKGGLRAEAIAVALAWKARGHPVKVTYRREEVFTSTLVRHPVRIFSRAGVDQDGQIIAKKVELLWNTGAYGEKGPWVCNNASLTASGPYLIPHVWIDGFCIYTHSPIAGPMRGFGVPQVSFAYESQMDEIAYGLGIDPLEFRLRHALDEADEAAWGERMVSIGLKECLKKAAAGVNWGQGAGRGRGKGIACMQKFSGTPPGVTSAAVKYNLDGSLEILTSSMEVGQGAMTVLAQIAAEELGVPLDRIRVSQADTQYTPFDPSTIGSRTTFFMGNAVLRACQDIKNQLLDMAGRRFEIPGEELTCRDGAVQLPGGREMALGELVRQIYGGAGGGGGGLLGRGTYQMEGGTALDRETGQGSHPAAFWMYGAQAVEVEVDPETGQLEIVKLSTAHDVGRAINPLNLEQQMEGALAMGVGNALLEELRLQEGQVMNPSLETYKIPTSLDLPRQIETLIVERNHPDGPYGAKGMAEPAIAPTAAAVANALFAATGVRLRALPLSADKIHQAIGQKAGAPGEIS